MKYLKIIVVLSFLISLQSTAFSNVTKPASIAKAEFSIQDSIPVTTIIEKNSKLTMDFPLEKVYVHTDKPYYAVGDTIWFKAYLTTIQNLPSPLSKIIYVEIMNEADKIVETLKLQVKNSVASGSLVLPNTRYNQENYHIRAYTQWMLNFSTAYFFTKNLPIGNAISKELSTHISFVGTATDKNQKTKATIQFKDEENKTLKNKKVTWEVEVNYDRISKGKGVTDEYGNLTLEFTSPKDVSLSEGQLITSVEVGKNQFLKATFPLKSTVMTNDVQFFPEGGDLIAGLPSQLAFKAIRSDGLGIELQGDLVDSDGNVLVKLTSQHLGMGKVTFTPELGKIYFANIVFSDGSKGTFTLPKVKTEGISLAVDNSGEENIVISINTNESYLKKNFNKGFYIIGRNGGNVYYAAQSVLKNQIHSASVPKSNFPTGIVQLSVLSTQGKVLSERLAFVRQSDTIDFKLNTDQASYKHRQKVKMKLNASNLDQAIKGNFSVSVINEAKVPFSEDQETTIFSSQFLSSDIEGYIEQPNYYFNHVTPERLANLDLLLLTQGYRRYLYADVIADKPLSINFLPEQALSVSGTMRRSDGMPVSNGEVLLQIPERAFYKDGRTDDKGKFIFTDLAFQDSVEAIINARSSNNAKNLMIQVDGEPYPTISKNINTPDNVLNLDSMMAAYLENSRIQNSGGLMLQEVQVESKAKKPSHRDHSALTGLNMQADYTTEGSQLIGNNLLNSLSSIMGLTYIDNILYLSRAYNSGNRRPVEIYVSGMPVDVTYLQSIQPSGVESIEVFQDEGMSGINQRSNTLGIVVINLKEVKKGVSLSKQELKDLFPPSNTMKFNPKGYSVERAFYVPKYSGPRTSLQAKDNRSTIHWVPQLITNENGEVEFEYFTADDNGTYRVTVEGIGAEGQIGRAVYRFQVN